MILKLLLVITVIAVVYFIFIKKKPLNQTKDNNNKTKTKKNEKPQSNDMVECSICGVYSELSETIISNNKYYCSDECVDKA